MHVDTHGGYLNLMTHQRDVLVVASPSKGTAFHFRNTDSPFAPVECNSATWDDHPAFGQDWHSFITDPSIQNRVLERRGQWSNYVDGCVARVRHHWRDRRIQGMNAVVGSDLPRGAALSSSTALSLAIVRAITACNGLISDDAATMRLGQEAEWFTGARSGLSDQAAMVLGDRNALVSMAIQPNDLDTRHANRQTFPDELDVLVIDSLTERSLSGAQHVEYTRNRFAYSLAMEILRHELLSMGMNAGVVNDIRYLSDLSAPRVAALGGVKLIYACLRRIPETIAIDILASRYALPQLHSEYDRYFGSAPAALRPKHIGLRGPLLFGIAESERARIYPGQLADGAFGSAGAAMTVGHAGDRVVDVEGNPYRFDISDENLIHLANEGTPIEHCPGAYGASSPAMDALVDTALEAGALGASLTGGGIAGAVLALCSKKRNAQVVNALVNRLASEDYWRIAGLSHRIDLEDAARAVVTNHAVAPLGEIVFE
jgi:galactokinase